MWLVKKESEFTERTMAKPLKPKKHKVAPQKVVEEDKKIVLVGTYKSGQLEKWPGYYNYPICDGDKIELEFAKKVNEIWLFNAKKEPICLKAEFIGFKTRDELKTEYGYPATGKPHGTGNYILYSTSKTQIYNPASGLAEKVIVRLQDFATSKSVQKKLRDYLDSPDRKDPLLANCLPPLLTKLPPEVLRVCEAAVQMDFLSAFDRESLQKKNSKSIDFAEHARKDGKLTCVEICAGAGGQAIGLERAGFAHVALVEYEREYCDVLKNNNPEWNVICADVHKFDGKPYAGVDLLAGGVPCPPFSVASKQLGKEDERDLFPEALRLIGEIKPKAVMIENVRGLLDPKFDEYRNSILRRIDELGYNANIKLLHASDFGVPQIRPRVVIVGIRKDLAGRFVYPVPSDRKAPTVGEALRDMMAANGWRGVDAWVKRANAVAPTIVGGSKKHGGPDLGPTRARRAWAELGVDGLGIANTPPQPDFEGNPKLTKEMIAIIQGFPPEWNFGNKKTSACRMIGNAFPPPVAMAVGNQIRKAIES